MAMTSCPECKSDISDKASSCPKCGAPIAVQPSASGSTSWTKNKKLNWIAAALLVVGAGYFFLSPTGKEISLPPLPVEVKIREALLGPGFVISVTNRSPRALTVLATFRNLTLKQEKSFRMDLAPAKATEFGHAEGWAFASGDEIVLSHNDFQRWEGRVP